MLSLLSPSGINMTFNPELSIKRSQSPKQNAEIFLQSPLATCKPLIWNLRHQEMIRRHENQDKCKLSDSEFSPVYWKDSLPPPHNGFWMPFLRVQKPVFLPFQQPHTKSFIRHCNVTPCNMSQPFRRTFCNHMEDFVHLRRGPQNVAVHGVSTMAWNSTAVFVEIAVKSVYLRGV